ncbi:hypothetical protein [Paenimyroides viscosum]|uniref:Lipoprotein n=1 Tax=Paenimyroides viscosum TaxID=2488729 RepID=A0A3P1AQZ2_9FLAO|nr:hypothetical protein [Paenimyroides viscosum]RRA91100.1 hypothetical protein EG242_13085 [Paenimyroides viscosum]
MTVSCHDEEDPIATTSPYAKYKGSWLGTYSGSDSGTIDFIVNGDGKIIGDVESNGFKTQELTLKGKVNIHGELSMILVKTNDDGTEEDIGSFVGSVSKSNGSGTWVNDGAGGIKGTWIASK